MSKQTAKGYISGTFVDNPQTPLSGSQAGTSINNAIDTIYDDKVGILSPSDSGKLPKVDSTGQLEASSLTESAISNHLSDTVKHVTAQDKTDWGAKYNKPSSGIPKTDMASDVQSSLDKADSAIQSLADYSTTTQMNTAISNHHDGTKEDVSNKVTSINGLSTNSQYPSAKAVVDFCNTLFWYGVEFDTTISYPACTRIGNSELHRTLPIQSAMRGCLLNDDGEVVSYLNASDWTSETRDGSLGQVMVEIPEFYIKFETEGTKRRVKMSTYPISGFHLVPKRYVSAYQATVDRTNSKLASVRNFTAQYRGCGNQSEWDGTYRSALGKPATGISLTSYRSYARARKAGSTAWNCMTYGTQKALYWLFVVEYATFNSQEAFNAAKDASGYAQGGLGDGVTNADSSKWNAYNGYYPFIECGVTDNLGNGSGQVSVTVLNGDSTTFVTTNVNRYRGVEIPFGHVWHLNDGVLVEAGANDDTNLHKVFVASNPANFASSIGTGYAHVGNEARAEGYGKEHIFGDGGEIFPAATGGGSTTYLCDYHYQSIPASGKATHGVMFGGLADYGAYAGFACASSHTVPSYTNARIGSRLCYLPDND